MVNLDKVCTKLLVEIKKLYCPESIPAPAQHVDVKKELNLVDGDYGGADNDEYEDDFSKNIKNK